MTPAAETRSRDASGFTILEVLVAGAVLAALAAAVPRSVVAARDVFQRADNILQAQLVADAVAAERFAHLAAGATSGMLAGRRWSMSAVPSRELSATNETKRVLLHVRLSVEVSPSEVLTIETMRIGAGP